MAQTTTPLQSAYTRVFIIEGRARGDHAPDYLSCLRMAGLSQGFGDIERVECPDPYQYGQFIEVAQIRGATERPTTTLEGRYEVDVLSTLARLARKGCAFDVQLHMGTCEDPSSFNSYSKAVVLEKAQITNFSTEDLGALASGDNAAVNESVDVSAADFYEVKPLTVTEAAASVVINEVLDVIYADQITCGECEEESGGCEKIYAVTEAAGGSPATIPDILFSLDGGSTWISHDIDAYSGGEDANAIFRLGDYIVVVSYAGDSLAYVLKDDLNDYTDPTFTEVTTGFVAAGSPLAAWSTGGVAFIVGDGGYIYSTDDPTSGVTVIDAGNATIDNLNAVHAMSDVFAVAVGNNGAVVYTEDGALWGATTTRPSAPGEHLLCVWVKGENEWLVGSDSGKLYATFDKGVTWEEITFSGSGTGNVYDIAFATNSVGFMSHATTAPAGRVFRTIDGGYSWKLLPEASGTLPANDYVGALAACENDANKVVGVGLADDATDGFVFVGSAT
ncbi:MAG: WD40/YVTN/BNR-like repeat-containing protein [Planctomycetota bacterium]|jgi:photosystem II stability/assembly factor-like uncharacterized protein